MLKSVVMSHRPSAGPLQAAVDPASRRQGHEVRPPQSFHGTARVLRVPPEPSRARPHGRCPTPAGPCRSKVGSTESTSRTGLHAGVVFGESQNRAAENEPETGARHERDRNTEAHSAATTPARTARSGAWRSRSRGSRHRVARPEPTSWTPAPSKKPDWESEGGTSAAAADSRSGSRAARPGLAERG